HCSESSALKAVLVPSHPTHLDHGPESGDAMHHLLIGEGQIGQEIAHHAAARGDTLTILRRSTVTTDQKRARYGDAAPALTHVAGDVLSQKALPRSAARAESCLHL